MIEAKGNPAAAGGEGATVLQALPDREMSPLATTIAEIVEIGGRRRFAISQQIRLDNALGAMVRRLLGWRLDLPEKERKTIERRARAMIAALAKGQGSDEPLAAIAAPLVAATVDGRAAFDALRAAAEKEMRRLARTLPAHEWAKGVRGFGELAFAVVIAEAGDLGRYDGPAKLWKRCGLAVIDGERQRKKTDPDAAARHGYNPRRRAEIHAVLADPLLRAQWRGEKDGIAAHAIGVYGEAYARKKAEYLARDWRPKHADMAARRYMTKTLIRDLWVAWRQTGMAMISEKSL